MLILFNRHQLPWAQGFFDQPGIFIRPVDHFGEAFCRLRTFATTALRRVDDGNRGWPGMQQADIARAIGFGRQHFVIPAAGIGAAALIRVAMVKVARQQTTAGIGDAQRTMDENFKFHVRALLADFGNLVDGQFARQNHARNPHAVPEAHRRIIHRIGLHRQMNRHLRPGLPNHQHEPWVGHDQRIGL